MSAGQSAFIYNPPPYSFNGLDFHQLPYEARQFLRNARLAPPVEYNSDAVNDRRARRARELYRTLDGSNLALVEHWREMRRIEKILREPQTVELMEKALAQTRLIIEEMENDLLPERIAHLKTFVTEFDALVWVDVNAREGTPDQATEAEQRMYRNGLLDPILKHTYDALVAFDKDVRNRDGLLSVESPAKEKAEDLIDLPALGTNSGEKFADVRAMASRMRAGQKGRRIVTY